jgi:hypothetical protein
VCGPDQERVLLHHLVLYAYLGNWLYEKDENGDPKFIEKAYKPLGDTPDSVNLGLAN